MTARPSVWCSMDAEYRELLDARLAQFRAEVRAEIRVLASELRGASAEQGSGLRGEFEKATADLVACIDSSESRLIRWMIAFWASWTIILGAMIWTH